MFSVHMRKSTHLLPITAVVLWVYICSSILCHIMRLHDVKKDGVDNVLKSCCPEKEINDMEV